MVNLQAVFIDRDGTIGGTGHFIHPNDFALFEGAQEAILKLKEAGIKIFAFTNQHRISRGQATMEDFREQFEKYGFDDTFICPHGITESCTCRKPSPGMLLEAADKHGLDLTRCVVIGDVGDTDMLAAHVVGALKVLVRTGWGESSLTDYRHKWQEVEPDFVAKNINEAVGWILEAACGRFSNFDFLKDTFPTLYGLAHTSEELILTDPFAAMVNIKQFTTQIIQQIARDTGIVLSSIHVDGIIHTLWKSNILSEDMYLILREIELFDDRESEIFIDSSRVEYLLNRVHDFAVWFYKKYVDDTYVSSGFINQSRKEVNLLIAQQESGENSVDSFINIDGTVRKAEWGKSLQTLSNYESKKYDNGEKYEGQLVRGLKHGQGIYTWKDGTVYIGFWSKDLEDGYGEKKFANGDIYRGYWKNGAFDGEGTYIWKDGETYEGQWEDGLQHGFGTKISSNGVKNKGFWVYGEFVHSADQLNDGTGDNKEATSGTELKK
ncbi:HAD-IIIA family hydrolase [Paenibacillus alkalitolerans]|uniref:HAD-IIIA family hydrolase n=1 Tax=Paenibacillus alkalitolerans TaxID=2799335 RepID=UPI0018F53696|nr:HAD-IIIA family hydrolase [Paenibacillus alkalitolerans]